MEKIVSLQNGKVKKWAKLHTKKGRDEAGLFLVEGEHLISEALTAEAVEVILTDLDAVPFDFKNVVQVLPEIMKKLSENVSQVHYMAVCRKIERKPESFRRILLLDGVQDPGNAGTLIRTAASFSFDGVYLSEDCADVYNEKTIRSTQGALFHIPVVRCDLMNEVEQLKKEGVCVIATALQNARPMGEIEGKEKMAFILGNEGQGVHQML